MNIPKPLSYHVSRWSEDPYSLGSWSQLCVGGETQLHRKILGSPISDDLILAGEACDVDFPAMVNGAWDSGKRAARTLCLDALTSDGPATVDTSTSTTSTATTSTTTATSTSERAANPEAPIVIIGAGAAGISAARELIMHGINNVMILEARNRIGGRASTISLSSPYDGQPPVPVDSGPMWLQQFPNNSLARLAEIFKLTLKPTDFNKSYGAAGDGRPVNLENVIRSIDTIDVHLQRSVEQNDGIDISFKDAMQGYYDSLDCEQQRDLAFALADIRIDNGLDFSEASAKFIMQEPGVGIDDHWILEGYSALLGKLAEGIPIKLNCPVDCIIWGEEEKEEEGEEGERGGDER